MRQILDRVTVTGADGSVDPELLVTLQREFPFAEWGILVSQHKTLPGGEPRFPSVHWLRLLRVRDLRLSVHLCGRWVRRVCQADLAWFAEPDNYDVARLIGDAARVQLNFHGFIHRITDREQLAHELTVWWPGKQVICQIDGANDDIVSNLYDEGVRVSGLYDQSGGAGVLPGKWPSPLAGIYSGYAGGLSPENVGEQLEAISAVVTPGEPIWIDVETHVRSENDRQFDIRRVGAFLKEVEPWVIKSKDRGVG